MKFRIDDDPNCFEVFTPAIFQGLRSLKTTPKGKRRTALKEFVGRGIRYYTEQMGVRRYSQKALEFCESRGIDIKTLPLRDYSKIVGGEPNKPNLVLEHPLPIGQFIEKMLMTDEKDWEFKFFLYPGVCWITRDEDNILNSNGFKNKRPEGWKNCYDMCGIKLITAVY
jgi:hypothetical protein